MNSGTFNDNNEKGSDSKYLGKKNWKKSLFPCNSISENSPLAFNHLSPGNTTERTNNSKSYVIKKNLSVEFDAGISLSFSSSSTIPSPSIPPSSSSFFLSCSSFSSSYSTSSVFSPTSSISTPPAEPLSNNFTDEVSEMQFSPTTLKSNFTFSQNKRKNLMKRFNSDPTYEQKTSFSSQRVLRRRASHDNKENEINIKNNLVVKDKLILSKSPTSTPKSKKVAFSDETNFRQPQSRPHLHVKSFKRQASHVSPIIKEEENLEDLDMNSDTPMSNLPKNFERLLFSPLVEKPELEATINNENNNTTPTKIHSKMKYSKSFSHRENSTFTGLKTYNSFCFSQKGFCQNLFSRPPQLTQPLDHPQPELKSKPKVMRLWRSESVDEPTIQGGGGRGSEGSGGLKRRRNSEDVDVKLFRSRMLKRMNKCHSLADINIKSALNKEETHQNLIGDYSRKHLLPLIKGRHNDLKTISLETMVSLLENKYSHVVENCTIVDCRYPYEYEGGHIKGAINIYSDAHLMEEFFNNEEEEEEDDGGEIEEGRIERDEKEEDEDGQGKGLVINFNSTEETKEKRKIIVFHCEFSSERGPKLSRMLRQKDREINYKLYPRLLYPELYLLEGGYKAFYDHHPEFCEPEGYVTMRDPHFIEDLKRFRRSSSYSNSSKTLFK